MFWDFRTTCGMVRMEEVTCSLTAMDGLGTEVLRTRITGIRDQDHKGLLGKRYCWT